MNDCSDDTARKVLSSNESRRIIGVAQPLQHRYLGC
jgi:hypothetical protein